MLYPVKGKTSLCLIVDEWKSGEVSPSRDSFCSDTIARNHFRSHLQNVMLLRAQPKVLLFDSQHVFGCDNEKVVSNDESEAVRV